MKRLLLPIIATALLATGAARAWEAHTTHAGIAEAAAFGSRVHVTLTEAHGRALGWYEPLTVPKDAAPALHEKLAHLEPSEGYVPDARGRQPAVGWLVAGAVLEDLPAARGRHHFYDPVHKTGLTGANARGLKAFVERRIFARLVRERAVSKGTAAPDWVFSKENDLGMLRFTSELEKSVTAGTKAARDQHLAYALLCAGAMTHVLADLGSPSRTRDDLAEHLETLGAGPADRGSRFERLASVSYGRLGIATTRPIARPSARAFFTDPDGKGLADLTNARWFSSGTLPRTTPIPPRPRPGEVSAAVAGALRFPLPAPGKDLDLATAGLRDGALLRNADGVCLARYRVLANELRWDIPEDCAAEQIAAILPTVTAYTAGFLEFLFRGTLGVTADGAISVGDTALGKGTLTVLAEDAKGTRRVIGTYAIAGDKAGADLAAIDVPEETARVVALFKGLDANGQELVAVGTSPAPAAE